MDRNVNDDGTIQAASVSLSARRAWIEIIKKGRARRPGQVALRKESVDRNRPASHLSKFNTSSLSARRAWIEIMPNIGTLRSTHNVALRKESVDRNDDISGATKRIFCGRSPQGERG